MAIEPEGGVVIDQREKPRLTISQSLKMKGMLVVAVGLFAIAFISTRKPAEAGAQPPTPVATASVADARPVMAYAQKLMGLDEKAQQAEASTVGQPPRPVAEQRQDYGGGYQGGYAPAPPVDQVAEDRKKREYESLFASSVVRPEGSDRPAARQMAQQQTPGQMPAMPPMPSVQEITRDVVAAWKDAGGPTQALPAALHGQPEAQPTQAAQVSQQPVQQPTRPPAGSHRVYEGTVIDGILANRLEGSMAGPVNALVSVPVYAQDLTLVIPAGARVLGSAKRVEAQGETRLAVAFHRIVLPNGSDISLQQFVGLNQIGDVGLKDQVNRHLLSTFGASAAVGLITGFSQWVGSGFTRNAGSNGGVVVMTGGVSDSTARVAERAMDSFTNRLPTITIREGHRVRVYVLSDLDLPAYVEAR